MVDMTGNIFFEEDDEFFADAFRSISEIETSSLKAAENCNSLKQKNVPSEEPFSSSRQNQLKKSCSEISSSYNSDSCIIENSNKLNDCYNAEPHIGNSSFVQNENCNSNQRFLPGYTPKATKRKFPGPAGILVDEPPRKLSIGNADVSKNLEAAELELELIKSSQFSVEELLETVSWRKLQEDVSSNHNFLSSAKNFSVQRVLSDTSKKRLPKHIVVPILCLYIKKFNSEEPVSIYMDDTGEISGKVDKEVLELYRSYIKTGTSLILRKITFVCNVMLLEKSSLVSMYLDDGTVHHVQNWDTLTVEEPSNALTCIFPVTPKVLEKSVKLENSKVTPTLGQATDKKTKLLQPSNFRTFLPEKIGQANFNSPSTSCFRNSNVNSNQNISTDEANLSHDDIEMDDFDELLGNLDEKSFLEDF